MANLKLTWLLEINCQSLDVGIKGTAQRHKI